MTFSHVFSVKEQSNNGDSVLTQNIKHCIYIVVCKSNKKSTDSKISKIIYINASNSGYTSNHSASN